MVNPYHCFDERKREKWRPPILFFISIWMFHSKSGVYWSNNTGSGWAKIATEWEYIDRRVKSQKLERAVCDLESWVQYCSSEIFPQTFTKFKMFLYRSVCTFGEKNCCTFILVNSDWYLMGLLLRFCFTWKCIYEGSALKL